MKPAQVLPWVVVALGTGFFVSQMLPAPEESAVMHVQEFASLPVRDEGRFKPLDSVARVALMSIAHRQSATSTEKKTPATDATADEETSRTLTPGQWLLEILCSGLANQSSHVVIQDPKLLAFLDLKPRKGQRYRIEELEGKFPKLLEEVKRLQQKKTSDWTPEEFGRYILGHEVAAKYERLRGLEKVFHRPDPNDMKIFRIENDQVITMLGLKPRPGLRYSWNEVFYNKYFQQFAEKAERLRDAEDKSPDPVDAKVVELYGQLQTYARLANLDSVEMVPPASSKETWQTLSQAVDEMDRSGTPNPAAQSLIKMLQAYAGNDVKTFNREVAAYSQEMEKQVPTQAHTAGLELFFNHFDPFYLCCVLYVLVFVLCCLSWIGWNQTLSRSAFFLAVLIAVVHTWALGMRMYIQGRPPVTNLYSSAVFIGWAGVVICLVLERIYRNGLGTLVASVLGALTLLVAVHLSESGDTMEMLVAVLDTNFWLATHVTCVTLGYTATFVVGFLGMVYIFFGVLTPFLRPNQSTQIRIGPISLGPQPQKTLATMMYGIVCFATLLSFVGTVLGGLWADQSWGRFWGWDPKENGAVLIVIWNALILHARWGGLIKERGMAALAVVGNMITGWSWFGTNQLGVGLHNYGFNKTLATGLVIFWTTQMVFLALGTLPLRWWRSFAPTKELVPPAVETPKGKPRHSLRPA